MHMDNLQIWILNSNNFLLLARNLTIYWDNLQQAINITLHLFSFLFSPSDETLTWEIAIFFAIEENRLNQ